MALNSHTNNCLESLYPRGQTSPLTTMLTNDNQLAALGTSTISMVTSDRNALVPVYNDKSLFLRLHRIQFSLATHMRSFRRFQSQHYPASSVTVARLVALRTAVWSIIVDYNYCFARNMALHRRSHFRLSDSGPV